MSEIIKKTKEQQFQDLIGPSPIDGYVIKWLELDRRVQELFCRYFGIDPEHLEECIEQAKYGYELAMKWEGMDDDKEEDISGVR